MKKAFKWFRWIILYPLLALCVILIIVFSLVNIFIKPSNNRDWSLDQAILPSAEIKDDLVTIHNIRNFTYASTTSYTPNYYDKTYDLNQIKKVYYIVEPFAGFKGSAHTFLSFEFANNQFVAISIEIRKEKGESFSPIKGLFNQYELMYVIADEKDVIKLRSNYRKDLVYVYPAKADTASARSLFLSMVNRANDLKDHPEFYNSVTNTCTTNIADHINTIAPHKVPRWNLDVLLPEYSDKLAYDLGLIDTTLPFDQARAQYLINDRAEKYANDPDFSVKIRE